MRNKFFYTMLLSTVLGILFGLMFPEQMLAFRWLDKFFLNLLKLLVLPLTVCAVVCTVTQLSNLKRLRRVWLLTFTYILISNSIAVLIGLVLNNYINFKP